jgi:predicted Zn-dependent peptidase
MDRNSHRNSRLLLAALLVVLAPAALWAQGVSPTSQQQKPGPGELPPGVKLSAQMPGAGAPRPFAFPRAVTKTLANGLHVFVIPGGKQPAVSIRLVVPSAGTSRDPLGKPGVAAMSASLLTDGTATRSAQQIAEAIDFVGGTLSAEAHSDATYVTATVVKKDFLLGFELLSDVVLHPAFERAELDRRREQLLSNLNVQYSDPNYLADAVFSRVVYGQHPYGLPEEGTPETARKFEREDVIRFRKENYAPRGALLAVAGEVTPEEAFAAAEKFLGPWEELSVAPPPAANFPPAGGVRIVVVDKSDAVQTQIRVGKPALARNSADYDPFYVANRVFGGGFNSRLSTRVRQEKGLTYGAYSRLDARGLGGSFFAGTSTKTETTVEATKLVVDLIAQMAKGDVTKQELDFARDYLVGVFPIQTETPAQVAGRVLNVALYGLPADYNETYQQRILAVNAEQVRAMSARYLDAAQLVIVLVGNAGAFRAALKKEFPNVNVQELSARELDLLAPDLRRARSASAPATKESLEQGRALLSTVAYAAGGGAVAHVESMDLESNGKLFTPQGEFPLELHIQIAYPDRVRLEATLPFAATVQGFDGKSGWLASQQGAQDLPPSMAVEFPRSIALAGAVGISRLALTGKMEVNFIGEEEVSGKKALAVEWSAPNGPVRLYVDPAARLIIAARFRSLGPQGESETLQMWDDYRLVDGIQYPFHSVIFREGAKYTDTLVQKIKFNTKPEDAIFSKPK